MSANSGAVRKGTSPQTILIVILLLARYPGIDPGMP